MNSQAKLRWSLPVTCMSLGARHCGYNTVSYASSGNVQGNQSVRLFHNAYSRRSNQRSFSASSPNSSGTEREIPNTDPAALVPGQSARRCQRPHHHRGRRQRQPRRRFPDSADRFEDADRGGFRSVVRTSASLPAKRISGTRSRPVSAAERSLELCRCTAILPDRKSRRFPRSIGPPFSCGLCFGTPPRPRRHVPSIVVASTGLTPPPEHCSWRQRLASRPSSGRRRFR